MTTQIQIGNPNLSMLAQVKFPIIYSESSKVISAIDFRTNRPSDVVSTLVSIYDSRDLFVKELQVLLAQRLLAVTDGNYEKEVHLSLLVNVRDSHCSWHDLGQRRNLEILKIRFGEAPLQVCEVMLKDMTDSKRIDQHVQTQNSVGTQCNPIAAPDIDDVQSVLHPTIISRHFWPQFQTAKILMPGQLREYVPLRTAKVFVVLNHVQYSRIICARVYNVQTRQETTLFLSPWEHPSRDPITRSHYQRGCSTPRSRIYRAILGAGYDSCDDMHVPLLTLI